MLWRLRIGQVSGDDGGVNAVHAPQVGGKLIKLVAAPGDQHQVVMILREQSCEACAKPG